MKEKHSMLDAREMKSNLPRVSVVMAAYNRACLIATSIRSALTQQFQDLELIVVDDGSTDGTGLVVAEFQDPRIRYIYQKNQGVVAARNAGLAIARGEYVLFLDSDDILLPGAIEKAINILDGHPEVGFSYGRAYLMDERGRIFGLRLQPERKSYVWDGKKEIRKAIVRGNQIPTSTIMARRRCLEEVGFFDPAFRHGSEDFDLWVRLATKYAVAYIAEPLVIYRVHTNSITCSRKMAEIERSNGLIFSRIFNDPELGPLFSGEKRRASFHLYLRLADYASGSREMQTSKDYLFQALKMDPGWFLRRLFFPLLLRLGRIWLPPLALDAIRSVRRSICAILLAIGLKIKLLPAMPGLIGRVVTLF